MKYHPNFSKSEAGVALVEFAILAPLLLTLAFFTYDLGRALHHHFVAAQVAREGVRIAVGTRGLEVGQYKLFESGGISACQFKPTESSASSSCPINANQAAVLNRTYLILQNAERMQSLSISPDSRTITVEYGFRAASPVSEINVRVELMYRGLSGVYYDTPVGASLTSSYL